MRPQKKESRKKWMARRVKARGGPARWGGSCSWALTAIALWHCPHRCCRRLFLLPVRLGLVGRVFPGLMAYKGQRRPGRGRPQLIFTFVLRFPTAEGGAVPRKSVNSRMESPNLTQIPSKWKPKLTNFLPATFQGLALSLFGEIKF